ncbi:MAG TPA: SGNH/GDSL hydrolase family protein [Candidatus Lustribacter sp.]|nr:SGNH/GDSL hydrolase family protein [Candidatus Lustribacter sp.]
MSGILTVRGGIPRFARRVGERVPATIVAYGTSMTLFGQFLARLPERLAAETGGAPVQLVNCGFRGFFTFAGAFRVDAVLPHAPDLVLIEFAHNDAERDALDAIPAALDAIVAQVRAANPECEFAFVYLAPPGVAAAGPSPAMSAYERVADDYGYPSFDLAGLSEALVAQGRASWTGGPGPALTSDGIHHTAAVAELIGEPFAAAFIQLLRASEGLPPRPARPPGDLSLAQTARVPVAGQPKAGTWATGVPPNHAVRTAEAYDREVAEPQSPGASFRVRFEGTRVLVWAMGRGAFETSIQGSTGRYRVEVGSGPGWSIHTITPPLAPGSYELEAVALELPLVFGDLFVVGRLSAGTEVPGVVN